MAEYAPADLLKKQAIRLNLSIEKALTLCAKLS